MALALGRGVLLIRRGEADLRAPRSSTGIDPTFGTTAHWEGPPIGWPWPHATCYSLVRGIQNFHMDSRGWVDIAYTALPCPHGYVFEGRWIGRRTAANGTNQGNNLAYALCYLGGQGDDFTTDGRRAMRAAMDYLDRYGDAGAGRNGHRDWKPTECPGDQIYDWVHDGQRAGGAPTPPDEPPDPEDPDMRQMILTDDHRPGRRMLLTDGIHGRLIGPTEADYWVFVGVAAPGPQGGGEPWPVPTERIDRILEHSN
jgi:hypothetical protein